MKFLDTNIFLDAGSQAPEDREKREIAAALILPLDFAISTQVVQEYIANALGKKSLGLTESGVERTLDTLRAVPILPITFDLVLDAWSIRKRYGISQWDASIIGAAKELHCELLYTEDLNNGQTYDGVTVVNPFAVDASSSTG